MKLTPGGWLRVGAMVEASVVGERVLMFGASRGSIEMEQDQGVATELC